MDLSTNWLFMAGRLLLVHPDTQRDFWYSFTPKMRYQKTFLGLMMSFLRSGTFLGWSYSFTAVRD